MGISLNILNRLHSHVKDNVNSLNRVLELGAQQIVGDITISNKGAFSSHSKEYQGGQLIKHGDYANKIYQYWGLEYFSIDYSGENNCINIDLNTDIINDKYKNSFSVVTNFGTTEHIFNQANCFISAHNACAVDGIIIHVVPFQKNNEHGFYNYQPNFFFSLALSNNYEILDFIFLSITAGARNDVLVYELDMFNTYSDLPDNSDLNIMCVLKKTKNTPFIPPQQEKYTNISNRYSQSNNNYYLNRLLELSTEWAVSKEKFLRQINYKKVVLYGAGGIATSILSIKECREKVAYLLDIDPKKIGTSIFGVEVLSPENITSDIETIYITIDIAKGVIEEFMEKKTSNNLKYYYFND
ncbi:hypothetical protein [Marinomonas sp. 2405UD68-3]|uniref:hypothetical protein n=1 Tax=Marinomonas sp. 2405UD68-3 TaxID=3391835 RepID=UPI0039C9DEF5